jgi:hypothetical protein
MNHAGFLPLKLFLWPTWTFRLKRFFLIQVFADLLQPTWLKFVGN